MMTDKVVSSSIEEAKRLIAPGPVAFMDTNHVVIQVGVLRDLIARAELAGAVTPGPSARQIIRERIARLANGEVE